MGRRVRMMMVMVGVMRMTVAHRAVGARDGGQIGGVMHRDGGRRGQRGRRPCERGGIWLLRMGRRGPRKTHMVRRHVVGGARHGPPRHHGEILLVVDGGIRVETFLRTDIAQGVIRGGLLQVGGGGMGSRVVADQVEVVTLRGGDAERLFHQAVGLISIAIGAFFRPV